MSTCTATTAQLGENANSKYKNLDNMPITYLGIPLTMRRLTAAAVGEQSGGWVAQMEGLADEQNSALMAAPLIKSVLQAIPLHQLVVLDPPKKVFRLLEKIEPGFFWAGHGDAS
jgi:hypothetical protein